MLMNNCSLLITIEVGRVYKWHCLVPLYTYNNSSLFLFSGKRCHFSLPSNTSIRCLCRSLTKKYPSGSKAHSMRYSSLGKQLSSCYFCLPQPFSHTKPARIRSNVSTPSMTTRPAGTTPSTTSASTLKRTPWTFL